jgi:hypothetical protein
MSSADSVINGFKDLSEKIIKEEGITNSKEAYNKYKQYFVDDKIYDNIFEICFNIVLCQNDLNNERTE